MAMTLRSPAFSHGAPMPPRHSRRGGNFFPSLEWSGAPEGTRGFVLLVEDPDAPSGTFRHCGIIGIPADAGGLREGEGGPAGPHGLAYARNDFGKAGYDGPQPPEGHGVHHYHFRLLALDVARPELPPGADVDRLGRAARQHVLAEAELVGTFER